MSHAPTLYLNGTYKRSGPRAALRASGTRLGANRGHQGVYSILIVSLRLLYAPAPTLVAGDEYMRSRGELRIDPGQLGTDAFSGELELIVPYTDPELARALLRKAVAMTAGLQARIVLVAIHTVPFPADFRTQASTHG